MAALCHHVPTAFGALAEDVGTDLAVLGIVALAFFSALLTGTSTGLRKLRAIVGLAHHEAGVHGGEIGDVSAEAETFSHIFAFACTGIRAPFTGLGGFKAVVDAVGHLVVLADVRDVSQCHCGYYANAVLLKDCGPQTIGSVKNRRWNTRVAPPVERREVGSRAILEQVYT